MVEVLERAPAGKTVEVGAREAYYTICPVFVASNVAQEFGWIEEEFNKIGAKLSYLRALAPEQGYLPHFGHQLDHLFRDGGNIPSIWAKADVTDTTLIALTAGHHGGQIVVRADSDINRVGDLKGRRFGLYKSQNSDKVDWWRATGARGILVALKLAGLQRSDVEIVDAPAEDRGFGNASRPSELWSQRRREDLVYTAEVRLLEEGKVDAVYTSHGRGQTLERTGKYKVIEDFSRYPDWTLQVANSPYALTVNSDFARNNRDIVVAFLKATVRAARWINANREAAATVLNRVTYHQTPADTAAAIEATDFLPNLSAQNLAGLDIQKKFLVDHGYVKRDFDSRKWADASYLEEALR
ncbi:ABC transporter substrate-binding protein [Aminobacter sp. AP02]|uniref:ABC transporter substrate-binding protein n=1 Tax=Aminobacter sp. AP02 TaxID=2135737 RepID=UPI000D6AB890|nr:ABC transporter substrate-binding protein [Aminobacter sp. AP02]PWK76687.1 ABC-type nitrate/sulfonate/bicarbonate transport system substrate-binding protein [Aminobacter sp. AP02]